MPGFYARHASLKLEEGRRDTSSSFQGRKISDCVQTTREGYVIVNVEVASSSSFRDNREKKSFRDGVGRDDGHRDNIKGKRFRLSLNKKPTNW